MNQPFVHLNVHSYYSFGRGVSSLEKLCLRAKERNMDYLALTDTNGVYGLFWFLEIARENGIQPIIGAEVNDQNSRAILLAKSQRGYEQMSRVITLRHLKNEFALEWALERFHEDLIILSDSLPLIEQLRASMPRDSLFVEVQPGFRRQELLRYARKWEIPPVATNGVYFADAEDYQLHRLLRAIHLNTSLSRLSQDELAPSSAWLKSGEEMALSFPDWPEALENSRRIAEQCQFNFDLHGPVFPDFDGQKNGKAFELLRQECYRGAKKRYGKITPEVEKRLEYELKIIREKGFAPYFLVVQDIVRQSRRTCGRGSAAASIVSYCLEITHVDPIAHNLFFERFLNPGRKDPPDIDVDLPWDERDEILEYVFKKYGEGRTGMIANHVTFKARAAVREIAKVLGIPDGEIGRITKKMSDYYQRKRVRELVDGNPAYKNEDFNEMWQQIFVNAERLQGIPRNMSVHCGGVVITPQAIDRYVPLEKAPKGVNIIQWEKDQAEDAGLVKIDLLGNRSLAVIRDVLAAIKKNYGVEIVYEQWNPINDPKTQEIIRNGDTIGVFYVESPAMRLLQKKAKTGDFEHLVIHSSIIRPAANDYIREYLKRLHGEPYQSLHPLLDEILKETFGIMVYQEDVSRVAIALADFTPAEADELRKILSKKRIGKRMEDFREKFYQGARKKGVDEKTIDKIWEMILSFTGYSFCKPHSASFALVSYKSAYLRAHYPAEFMAAVISNQGGYYSTFGYISEARRMGLQVKLPEINQSSWHYVGKDDWIRVGFMQLKGIQKNAVEKILAEREKNGEFLSFDDFLKRTRIDPNDVKILIKAGVFDELEPEKTRPELIWRLLYWQHQNYKRRVGQTISLFEEEVKDLPPVPNYSAYRILQLEAETLGFLISRHPLTLYKDRLAVLDYVFARDLHLHVGEMVTTIGWLVTRKMVRTKKGDMMEFISFEDTTAIYETVFFPKTYQKFCYMLSHSRPYVLRGKVEEEFGAVTLNVFQVRFL